METNKPSCFAPAVKAIRKGTKETKRLPVCHVKCMTPMMVTRNTAMKI